MPHKEGQYIQTYLTEYKKKTECCFAGIRHEMRNPLQNEEDGFRFNSCKVINQLHPLGTIYLFEGYGYVCAGYFWFRFSFEQLVKLSN